MQSNNKKIVLILFFLLAGILFRLILANIFRHEVIADEKTYLEMADIIKREFWVAECCTRGFVYPMFLRIILGIFGEQNHFFLFFTQAVMDSLIGLILFLIYRKFIEKPEWGSWVVLIVYLFNPLTATYTGMILTETLTFFLLVSFLFLLASYHGVLGRFVAGIILGLLMFTRLIFVYWGILLIFILAVYLILKRRQFFSFVIPISLGVLLIVLYPSTANYLKYKTISPMPYIPGGNYDFLVSFRVHRWPILVEEHKREVEPILLRYYQINFNDREAFLADTGRRIEEVKKEIIKNPWPFALSRLGHIPTLWDKRSFCCYDDPFFPFDRPFIRIGNILFLSICTLGILRFIFLKNKFLEQKIGIIFVIVLLLYLTTALTLRVPEERHTMPAYPILLLFLPLGILSIKSLKS